MRHSLTPVVLALLGASLLAPPAPAQAPVVDSANLSARLQRLERSLNSSSLLQMATSVQDLQREIRELRGELELQSRDINRLRQRQRDLYLDIDKRLQLIEARGSTVPAAPATAPAPAPAPASGTSAGTPAAPATPVAPQPAAAAPGAAQAAVNAAATPAPPPAAGNAPAAATAPAPQATAPALGNADPAAEQQAYREAFDLLKAGKFDQAANALQGFLKNYPNGRFADNAQYWLGETYYVNRQFDPALSAFERLLVDYPDSPKRPHAMLKIGFIHDEAGRKQQARQVLTQLTQQYPQSTAAGLAKKRLSRLQ